MNVCLCLQEAKAKELKAQGVNPRSGQRYIRGAYGDTSAAAAVARLEKENQRKERAKEKTAKDHSDFQRLKTENAQLKTEIANLDATHALALKNKELEIMAKVQGQLLQKFQEGLAASCSILKGGAATASPYMPSPL